MLDRLYDAFATAQRVWARFSESRVGGWVQTGIYWAFLAGIVGYLAYRLTTIGWAELWTSMPTTPWFYVLLLLMYATLPVTEMVLYGTAWRAKYRALFSLPSPILWLIGGGHLLRFVVNNGFQGLQWAVVIPDVSAGTWITLLALYIVIQQIPTAALASMLLTTSLIDRTLNFATYVGTTALDAATVENTEALEDLSLADEMETVSEGPSARSGGTA